MSLFKKGWMVNSIFGNKCPRCQEGMFWPTNNPYNNMFSNKGENNDHCSVCGLKYERETGFWYGAMYVSYAIGVALMVTGWVATTVLFPDIDVFVQIGVIVLFIVALAPVNYHLSRLIWINFFVKYDKECNRCVINK